MLKFCKRVYENDLELEDFSQQFEQCLFDNKI